MRLEGIHKRNDGLGIFPVHGYLDFCVDMDSSVLKIGQKIEGTRLTPLRFSHSDKYRVSFYVYRCECGVEKAIRKCHVKNSHTKSCGCLGKESYENNFKPYLFKKGQGKGVSKNPDTEFKKGKPPWNKGKKIGRSWKKGKRMVRYPDGRIEWVEPLV